MSFLFEEESTEVLQKLCSPHQDALNLLISGKHPRYAGIRFVPILVADKKFCHYLLAISAGRCLTCTQSTADMANFEELVTEGMLRYYSDQVRFIHDILVWKKHLRYCMCLKSGLVTLSSSTHNSLRT